MHFYDDGLFVGQFGEANLGHAAYEGVLPGFAGNGISPDFTKTTNGDYYLWVNDESDHGPERWHFVNASNIREQNGSGILGGMITVTNKANAFPVNISCKSGNQSSKLSWNPVPGAVSYTVRYSVINGGPYQTIAGSTTGTNYVIGGLENGQIYYIVVDAVTADKEGSSSEQVEGCPFDTTQTVLCAGSMSEGGQATPIVDVSSSAAVSGKPSFLGSEHLTGILTPLDLNYYGYGNLMSKNIGNEGYTLYDWGGAGSNLSNLSSSFSITKGSGWIDLSFLGRQYRVDNLLGTNLGLSASPTGTINIGVSDTNFHFLTVISPSKFNDPRKFTLGIISTNGTSAQYSVSESNGYNHTFQFLFRGNITLQANATGGNNAIIQAIFLDGASGSVPNCLPVYTSPRAPTGLHLVTNMEAQ
jgi:hypothetical protein